MCECVCNLNLNVKSHLILKNDVFQRGSTFFRYLHKCFNLHSLFRSTSIYKGNKIFNNLQSTYIHALIRNNS